MSRKSQDSRTQLGASRSTLGPSLESKLARTPRTDDAWLQRQRELFYMEVTTMSPLK